MIGTVFCSFNQPLPHNNSCLCHDPVYSKRVRASPKDDQSMDSGYKMWWGTVGLWSSVPKVLMILVACFLAGPVHADVSSTNGLLSFDRNSDGTAEMSLNSTGLGIGVTTPAANLHVQGNAIISHQLSVGGSNTSSSNLYIQGSYSQSISSVSSNTTLSDHSTYLVDNSSANITLSLPYAANVTGRILNIKATSSSHSVFVLGGGNYIDNSPVLEMSSSNSSLPAVSVNSNGQQWYVLGAQYANIVGSANLLSYWAFDESTGSSLADRAGTGVGAMVNFETSGNGLGGLGKISSALDLDGANDYVNALASYAPKPSTEMTISVWLYPRSVVSVTTQVILQDFLWNSGNSFGFAFGLYEDDLVFRAGKGNGVDNSAYKWAAITTGSWQHFAITYKSGTVTFYKNGVSIGADDSSTDDFIDFTGTSGRIITDSSNNLNGKIDELYFFNSALTPDQIWEIYQSSQ